MGLQEIGTLPVSALNIGVSAALPGIQAEISKLEADIAKATGNIALAAQFIPPDPTALAEGLLRIKDPAVLAAALNPANWVTGAASANADLLVELGIIEALLDLIGTLTATFELGISAGSLSGWAYSGRAAGFGSGLAVQTRTGWGPVGADDDVNALILATELFASWESFSLGFNTGGTPSEVSGLTTTETNLAYLGTLNGGEWNTGLLRAKVPIDLFKFELEGLKATLQAQIDVSLGLNLPDIGSLLEFSANFSIDDLLPGLSIQTDFLADIRLLELKIEGLLNLIGDLTLALSGGGLTLWVYDGPANELGASFQSAISAGLPGANGPDAPAYGLCIASELPSAWASFGLIFKNS